MFLLLEHLILLIYSCTINPHFLSSHSYLHFRLSVLFLVTWHLFSNRQQYPTKFVTFSPLSLFAGSIPYSLYTLCPRNDASVSQNHIYFTLSLTFSLSKSVTLSSMLFLFLCIFRIHRSVIYKYYDTLVQIRVEYLISRCLGNQSMPKINSNSWNGKARRSTENSLS